MVRWLEPRPGVFVDDELDGPRHPNRRALDDVVSSPAAESAWQELRQDYSHQAEAWNAWVDQKRDYALPLVDGLGFVTPGGVLLEVGAGSVDALTGVTGWSRISCDISEAMLARHPGERLVCCDVRRLPLRDASVAVVAGLNAVPHFGEFSRVIQPGGHLLWATSFGPRTPMYVSPEDLERQLPGWTATARLAGAGEWTLLERNR